MNRYGVLAAYLPEFGKLVGRMQYDLFHAYTIDEHILFVVRNLRRMTVPEHTHELPDCSEIIQRIPKPELLYLAGLFHDIGKGRGGDHSIIGEDITREFCTQHQLSEFDTELVSWLVRHHLDMSRVINKQDVSDSDVINAFARLVRTGTRLDYLYLLTVADIRGTNPNLWSSWKHSLLKELYTSAHRAIKRGLDRPLDDVLLIQETRNQAMALLADKDIDEENIEALWDSAGTDYFLYHTPVEIGWHTEAILNSRPEDLPLVELFTEEEKGSTAVLIYGPFDDRHFSMTTTALEQLCLTVVDARIINLESGYSLDTFRIIEETNEEITEPPRLDEIQHTLSQQLKFSEEGHLGAVTRRTPRALRHFSIQTQVIFHDDEENNRTVVNVITSDRPGVLSRIARVFNENAIRLQVARINTIGTRIEDVFYVTTTDDQPVIDKHLRETLRQDIIDQLKD
jgi:[protein-PII] uridylyltransferase